MVRLRQLIITLLIMSAMTMCSAVYADDAEIILRDALHSQYSSVEEWKIAVTKAIHMKRSWKIFSQSTPDIPIYRDGHLFAVHLKGAVTHYSVAANKQTMIATSFIRRRGLLTDENTMSANRDALTFDCPPATQETFSTPLRVRAGAAQNSWN